MKVEQRQEAEVYRALLPVATNAMATKADFRIVRLIQLMIHVRMRR